MTTAPEPRTSFDWFIYADATFAGLSVLIPIPGLDWIFEELFRRRMPGAIAKRRRHTVDESVRKIFNASNQGCLRSCLGLPLILTVGLLKRLSRKILYFLTVKEASDKLSYYWHQAFLLDYMLLTGHLKDEASASLGRQAMDQILDHLTTSPMSRLAIQITSNAHHILRTLRGAQHGEEDEVVARTREKMLGDWRQYSEYLEALAERYWQTYHTIQAQQNQVDDTSPM